MLFIMPYITLFYFTVLFVVYLIPYIKNKTVKDLINLITYSLLLVGIIVFIFIPVDAIATVAFPMAAYCLVMGIRSLLSIKLSHITGKTDAFLIINSVIHLLLAFVIIYSFFKDTVPFTELVIDYGLIYIFDSMLLFMPAFSERHDLTIMKILRKTYAKEVLSGLILMMVIFSFIFTFIEPTIATFGEGMWYCFAVVTTIGFGDYAATTTLSRVLTIFIGVYGIIVVALITSVIVNIYTETKDKNKDKENDK